VARELEKFPRDVGGESFADVMLVLDSMREFPSMKFTAAKEE
jgi:hypothetical protein